MSSPHTASSLRESGSHLVGHCPFHEEEHPSFAVYPGTRSFYCFGCNAGGDVIDFVRRADDLASATPWSDSATESGAAYRDFSESDLQLDLLD